MNQAEFERLDELIRAESHEKYICVCLTHAWYNFLGANELGGHGRRIQNAAALAEKKFNKARDKRIQFMQTLFDRSR
jgi:putative heme iron utilization protein